MEMKSGFGPSVQEVECKVSRPTANYKPSVWGDLFLSNVDYQSQTKNAEEERLINELVEEIRRELKRTTKTSIHQLQLIDSIQRLGVAYHFEFEISQALQAVFETYDTDHWDRYKDIYGAALSFRLLRQQGYRASCSVFEKFKGADGEFNSSMTGDLKGMLEFYEATFLNVHGENILDEGRDFARFHLNMQLGSSKLDDSPIYLVEKLIQALKHPYWRGITRLEARAFISIYEKNPCHNKTLLRLAKLDFNRLLSLHKRELAVVSRWWKQLDVKNKLPFARDRIVECYFWAMTVFHEPKYAFARKFIPRVISVISIIDDLYDSYGTLEELEIFSEAIERWSSECLDWLPTECFKVAYETLLKLYQEIEEELAKQGKPYLLDYAKEAIKISARGYLEEARWRENSYVPTMKEYMDVSTKSCSYLTIIVTSYVFIGDIVTQEHLRWALENPLIINASCMLCRLQDDVVGYEFEKERDHVAVAVDCYMKEHNATKQEAIDELNKQLEAVLKDLNEGFLASTGRIPSPLLYCVINFSRFIEVIYKEKDHYIHVTPEMQSYIRQVLVDPIQE